MKAGVKGSLLLIVAFALGIGAGALGFGVLQARMGWGRPPHDPGRFQQQVLARLTKELSLRPDQQKSVEAILTETVQEFSRLREEIGPRFHDIRTRSQSRIRAVLDAEQQAQFDRLRQEWERRDRRHEPPPEPPGPERKGP